MLTLHYYCKSKGIILICFSLIQYLLLANFTFYLIQNIFSLLEGNEFIQTPATQHSNNFTNNVKGGKNRRKHSIILKFWNNKTIMPYINKQF